MHSSYAQFLKDHLSLSRPTSGLQVLDLFAGCGGLSLGFEAAGFQVQGYDMNVDACATYRTNLQGPCHCESLTTSSNFPPTDILIGGPPCQPFSVLGSQSGATDKRNGFEIFIAAVDQLKPLLWMFENVRGMLGRSRSYLEQVLDRLRKLDYQIEEPKLVNAKDYSVPQNRERIIVVGHRLQSFEWPSPSSKRVNVRQAIGRTAQRAYGTSRFVTASMDAYIARYEKASCCRRPRDLELDAPARTLTCRNLGGATGDMIRLKLPNGRRRLLTIQEAARLQSFPSTFKFEGSMTSQFQQIGNAVPPLMAFALATAIRASLENGKLSSDG